MTDTGQNQQGEIRLYIEGARQMLQAAEHNLAAGFYATAVNRAYYAVFYAANAALATENEARGKHSGVISAFRERFVKTGTIETEYSRIYGRLMDDRHSADYELARTATLDEARRDVEDAGRFVKRLETYLGEAGWL